MVGRIGRQPETGEPEMADDFKVVCEIGRFQKNATSYVVGSLLEVRGVQCGDIRVHAVGVSDSEIPTKAGLTLRVPQLRRLRGLLDDLLRASDDVWGLGAGDGDGLCDAAVTATKTTQENEQ